MDGINHDQLVTYHAVSYFWDGFDPNLILYNEGVGRLFEFTLDVDLNVYISKERRCVGFESDNEYHPCPRRRTVSAFGSCQSCASVWLPQPRCVFEPKCTGDMCDHPEFCNKSHVVYLAFFGTLMKVGMTGERRLLERGIEQGADAIAPIFRCANRLKARQLEREVSKRFKINQEFRTKKILSNFEKGIKWEKIEAKYRSTLIRIGMWNDPLGEPLSHLDSYPIGPLPAAPAPVITEGKHSGEIIGIKGKHLIYRNEMGILALDLSDVPSRFISVPRPIE